MGVGTVCTVKFDIHVHSMYSHDSISQPKEIIAKAKRLGLDGVIITEHNSYDASEPWEKIGDSDLLILRGVEYKTREGHVLIYGIKSDEYIPTKKIPLSVIAGIAEQKDWALVAAHPFKGYDDSIGDMLHEYHQHFAALEYNSKCDVEQNGRMLEFAREHNIPVVGGSDAHYASRVGRAYTTIAGEVSNMKDFVRLLKAGEVSFGENEPGEDHLPQRKREISLCVKEQASTTSKRP